MQLYNAQGQPLSVQDMRSILQAFSSGNEDVPRVYTADGDALGTGAGNPAKAALGQALTDAGFDEQGGSARGPNGEYYIPLDDPAKLAQAQQLGVVQYVNGVPVANYNDPNLRGAIGSGALFADMPQTGFVQDILTNPAFLTAITAGTLSGSGLLSGAADAGAVTGGGVGGGAGGVPGLLDYSMTGTMGGGLGTAAAGGAADAAALGGSAVGATATSPFSLASGVGGALGGADTLGAGAGAFSLGSSALNGLGSALGDASSGATTSNLGSAASAAGATTPLARLLGLGQTGSDLASVLGPLAGAGLGYLGAGQQAGALTDIYNQQRADRQGALNAYNGALASPDTWYQSAPAMGAADATLRALSVNGNPADNPGDIAKAAAYNLGGYTNYLNSLSGPAFGGQSTQAQLGTAAAGAQGGQLNALGYGLGSVTQPQNDIASLLKQLGGNQNYSLNVGGLKYG